MKNFLKRLLSIALAFTMLVGIMPLMAQEVEAATPLTDEQVVSKLYDFVKKVTAFNSSGPVYWNAGGKGRSTYNEEKLEEIVNNDSGWEDMFSTKPCSGDRTLHNVGPYKDNCQSCMFMGDSQCSGFAKFITYFLFEKEVYSGYNGPFGTDANFDSENFSVTTKDLSNFTFRPGDIIRYDNNGHSVIVYKVNGKTLQFLECNYGKGLTGKQKNCVITWTRSIDSEDIDDFIKSIDYVISPKESLRTSCPIGTHNPKAKLNNGYSQYETKKVEGVWKAVCKECGTKYDYMKSFNKNDAGLYSVKSNQSKGLFNSPYDPNNAINYTSKISKGDKYTVLGSIINAYGNTWYCTIEGKWIYGPNLQKDSSIVMYPQNFKLTYKTSSSANVSWSSLINADHYIVEYKRNNSSWTKDTDYQGGTSYTTTLNHKTKYNFRICAVYKIGTVEVQSDWAYFDYDNSTGTATKSTLTASSSNSNITITQGKDIDIAGYFSSNYTIKEVQIKKNGTFVLKSLPYSTSVKYKTLLAECGVKNLPVGNYTYALTATDSTGKSVTSTIVITVKDGKKTCAPPSFSETNISKGKDVTISCSTSGAEIYYRIGNGNWQRYSEPIHIYEDTKIYAKATASGMNDSSEISKNVAISKCSVPEINATETSKGVQVVMNAGNGETIYYSLGGSGIEEKYEAPLTITSDTYIVAYATKLGSKNSEEAYEDIVTHTPSIPVLKMSTAKDIAVGDAINCSWDSQKIAEIYKVYVKCDDELIKTIETNNNFLSVPVSVEGKYEINIVANNYAGDSDVSNVITATAHNPLTVRFIDWDGTIISEQKVKYGTDAEEPSIRLARRGYTFLGWDKKIAKITSDTDINAEYEINTYTIKYYDVDKKYIGQEEVKYGDSIQADIVLLLKPGYVFAGWHIANSDAESENDLEHIDSDMELVATQQWGNEDLPVVAEIIDAARNAECSGYDINIQLSCADTDILKGQYKKVKVIAALKSLDDQMLASETRTLNLIAGDINEGSTDVSMFVSYTDSYLADLVEVSVVGIYENDRHIDYTGGAVAELVSKVPTAEVVWSEWFTEEQLKDQGVELTDEMQQAEQYRYIDSVRSTVTRSSSSTIAPDVDGYELFSSSSVWGSWSSYSDKKVSEITENDIKTREVETKTVTVTPAHTEYRYGRWTNGSHYTFCNAYGKYKYPGTTWTEQYTEWSTSLYNKYLKSNGTPWVKYHGINSLSTYSHVHKGAMTVGNELHWYIYYKNGNNPDAEANQYFWQESKTVAATTKQQYRYRDKTFTYNYEKWTEATPSDWSFTSYEEYELENSKREVEKRTVYRYILKGNEKAELNSDVEFTELQGTVLYGDSSLAGKYATVLVYKQNNTDPTEPQLEYIGSTCIGENNTFNLIFKTKENISTDTGDYIVTLAIEGASNVVDIAKIEVPKPLHQVQFYDINGNPVGDVQFVADGESAIAPELYEIEGYEFLCWKQNPCYITADTEIMPAYSSKRCCVVFVDYENETIELNTDYRCGDSFVLPDVNAIKGKIFDGWDIYSNTTGILIGSGDAEYDGDSLLGCNFENYQYITEDCIFIARWIAQEYDVTFYDANGNVIETQSVEYGKSASLPDTLAIPENMTFLGWSTNTEWWNVTNDIGVVPLIVYNDSAYLYSNVDEYCTGSQLSLELYSNPDAVIYYTIDGSEPNPENLHSDEGVVDIEEDSDNIDGITYLYDGEIELAKSTYVQAIAYCEDKNCSDIIDVYFEYYPDTISDKPTDIEEVGTYMVSAVPGAEVTIKLNTKENLGLLGYLFTIECDNSVFCLDYNESGYILTPGKASEDGLLFGTEYGDEGWQILWAGTESGEGEQELFEITLHVYENAEVGTYPITIGYSKSNTITENGLKDFESISAEIATDSAAVIGDVNGDNTISVFDVILIMRNILGMNTFTPAQKISADVNYDGNINNADAIKLLRCIVGLERLDGYAE